MKSPLVLCILDGFGLREERAHNAVKLARTPTFDHLFAKHPWTAITTHGRAVGLAEGVMGNSEVGHMNLGAGRVVFQESTRISNAVADRSFFDNPAFASAASHVRDTGGSLHLWALISDGVVHTAEDHYLALIEWYARTKLPGDRLLVHAFLDGRDTPPKSGLEWMRRLDAHMKKCRVGRFATVMGRYFAMDRDQRWERLARAYHAMTASEGFQAPEALGAVQAAYDRGETDEFMQPTVIAPLTPIRDGDAVIFANFRADRAREISHAFLDNEWPHFERGVRPRIHHVSMTHYDDTLVGRTQVAFAPHRLTGLFGELLATRKLRQLRIAETEKYAHVTFFFNGGQETVFPGEDRALIASPKVDTYDQQPQMSAPEVTDRLIAEIERDLHDVIILNYANGDMVGHTGVEAAAIKAVEALDTCLSRLTRAVLERDGTMLVTADHGNCEQMWNADANAPHTQHTTNLVPALLVSNAPDRHHLREGGALADVAPTLCELLGVEPTPEMTGKSLLAPAAGRVSR